MADWLRQLASDWWADVSVDAGRYVVFAIFVWLLLWVILRTVLAKRKIRRETPAARQMVVEFLISVRSVIIFSTASIAITRLAEAGYYPLPEIGKTWGPAWFWVSAAIMVIGHDAYYYWVHRAMHRPAFFRKFHRRHHRSYNPSPFTAYSFDLREAMLMVLYVAIWPLITPTPWHVVSIFMIHQIVRNTVLHCGYELMPAGANGRPMLDWLTTTTHHDLHHSEAGSNFALYFTWWDRWMGTENPQYMPAYAKAAWRFNRAGQGRPAFAGAPDDQNSGAVLPNSQDTHEARRVSAD